MGDRGAVVLVVEDDENIRELLVEYLDVHGFAAEGAANGREALDKLEAMQRLPCVILLDYAMPVMDGREFYAELRRDVRFADVPVVVVSAQRPAIDTVERLPKPFEMERVLEVVERYRRAARAA